MPDILGYWDRRADDPDFNPATEEIEPGYQKKMQRMFEEEDRKKEDLLKKLYDFLGKTGITKSELEDAGYSLSVGYTNEKYYTGRINGECFGLDEGRLLVDKITKEPRIEVVYKDEDRVERAEEYNESFIENLCDLLRIESAIRLRYFLDKKKIPYQEEPSRQKVKNELKRLNKRVSRLIKKIQNGK